MESSFAGNTKRPDMGGLKKIPRGQGSESSCGTGVGPHGRMQMCNLVIGVVSRPTRITHAASDRVGACGAKLLNGFFKSPVAGRPTASLPVRTQFTTTRVLCKRVSFFCERVRNGGWYAPEELDTQVLQKQSVVAFQLFTSLLLVRRGWFTSHTLSRKVAFISVWPCVSWPAPHPRLIPKPEHSARVQQ